MPLWLSLFNEGVVEVVQWVITALAVLGAAYLGGCGRGGGASFFFVLSIGLGLILIEETGNVRLKVAETLGGGGEILGMHSHVLGSVPVYALLAFFPVYALLRYGKHVWEVRGARPYLIATYCLYGGSQLAALSSHLFGVWYARIGEAVNTFVFAGALPPVPGIGAGASNYYIMDSLVEESLELLAAATMLALVLAYAKELRSGRAAVGANQARRAAA